MADELPDDIRDIYDLLRSDRAYNKDCIQHTNGVIDNMKALAKLIDLLGLDGFGNFSQQLDLYVNGAMANLSTHLNDQFANLPTNLGLVSGYINDMANLSRLPGFNLPDDVGSSYTAGGGFVSLRGVSSRAMMLGAPMVFYAPETGSGSGGGASPTSGKCSSMGDAFGSIMGKASQFMGQAMGMLGQMSGLVSGIMGGGVLGAISQFANLGSMAGIPGIGQLNSLMQGGFAQLGNLGSMGNLISAIGNQAGIGQLGQLGQMLGGSMAPLQQLGGMLQQFGGMTGAGGQTSAVAGGLGGFPVSGLQDSFTTLRGQINNADTTELQAQLNNVADQLIDLLGSKSETEGLITNFVKQLQGMAEFLRQGKLSEIGDISKLLVDLDNFVGTFVNFVAPTPQSEKLVQDILLLVQMLTPFSNISGMMSQIDGINSNLSSFGGTTGYGNVGNFMQQASGLLGSLNGIAGMLGNIPGLGGLAGSLGAIGGVVGQMNGLMGALGAISSGNIMGAIGGLGGLMGGLQGIMGGLGGGLQGIMGSLGGLGGLGSILGGQGLGGLTGMLGGLMGGGGLGGIMGGIGSMIGGEKGLLGAASGALGAVAGSYNLKLLQGDACASGVLGNVGSAGLNQATGGGGGGGGTSDFSGASSGSASPLPAPRQGDFGFNSNARDPLYDPSSAGGTPPRSVTDLPAPIPSTFTPPTAPVQGPQLPATAPTQSNNGSASGGLFNPPYTTTAPSLTLSPINPTQPNLSNPGNGSVSFLNPRNGSLYD